MIPAYGLVLGPIFGFLLSIYVDDETQWYPKQFLWSAIMFLVVGVGFATSIHWSARLLLAGVGVYLLFGVRIRFLALLFALLAVFVDSLVALQLLFVALLPLSGLAVHHQKQKDLWWFALVPIVITASLLL